MVPLSVLEGPRLKVERAKRHIDELIRTTTPLDPGFYSLQVEPNVRPPEVKPREWVLTYRPKKPIPETLALIIGDAVHNLRAALDYLATGIVRTVDPTANPYFPVTKYRKDLVTSGWLKAMEEALPGSENLLLVEIRPLNDGRNHLWRLGSLDIDDKHNLLTPTVVFTQVRDFDLLIGGSQRVLLGGIETGEHVNANEPLQLVGARQPIEIQQDLKATVLVSFREGDILKDKPVIPTLTQMSELVSETLNAFERLLRRQS